MKMFKKLAAVIMAAAMALTLLTACGGGGGSALTFANSKTGKLFSSLSSSKSLYIEMGSDTADSHMIMATNGTKSYMLLEGGENNANMEIYDDGAKTYIVDHDDKMVLISTSSASSGSILDSIDESTVAKVTSGTKKIGGTTYQTETITYNNGSSPETFYYLGSELKYHSTGSGDPIAFTVKTSFKESILDYSKPEGYTEVTSSATVTE